LPYFTFVKVFHISIILSYYIINLINLQHFQPTSKSHGIS